MFHVLNICQRLCNEKRLLPVGASFHCGFQLLLPNKEYFGAMPKILVLDNLSQEGVDVFQQAEGFEVDVKPPQNPDELAAIIGEYDGLVVRSGTKVTAESIAAPGKLKVIGRAGRCLRVMSRVFATLKVRV